MISNVSQALAETVGRAWAASARAGWERHGTMFEKYDSGREGERGAGGEYAPQEGFGWSNGAALLMVERYFLKGEG